MAQPTAAPVIFTERSMILDILRGFAILGIFLNNSEIFSGYGFTNETYHKEFSTFTIDNVFAALQTIFVEGKFYSLFSLLFGIGFSIILIRNEQKGINPLKVFYRRLFILLLFGLGHLLLLWDGDILVLYALIGFILPLFRKCSDKTLLIWAICLILSPIFIDIIRLLLHWSPGDFLNKMAQQRDAKNGIPPDDSFAFYLYKDGSGYSEIRKWLDGGLFYRYEYILDSNRIMKVLGIFLIGFYVGRKMIYARLEEYKPLLKKIRNWGFLIGLPISVVMCYFEADKKNVPTSWMGMPDTVTYALSVVPLSFAYASTIALLWLRKKEGSRLNILAPVGRMALTNYLSQTIFAILIFYNIGFGVGTKTGYTYVVLIVLAVYAFQVLYSNIWFRYFQYGPMEWIWRQLTYGKRLKFRR
jgi:uncharacterized protein